jgi:hypothetical protein
MIKTMFCAAITGIAMAMLATPSFSGSKGLSDLGQKLQQQLTGANDIMGGNDPKPPPPPPKPVKKTNGVLDSGSQLQLNSQ